MGTETAGATTAKSARSRPIVLTETVWMECAAIQQHATSANLAMLLVHLPEHVHLLMMGYRQTTAMTPNCATFTTTVLMVVLLSARSAMGPAPATVGGACTPAI